MDGYLYHEHFCDLNTYVARQIRQLREEKNLTQTEVAGCLGITRQAYGKIENDITKITVNVLEQLCLLYHISIYDFFPDDLTDKISDTIS